jgi:hypothetical protein
MRGNSAVIKMINAALDIVVIDGEERLAIRGVIDPMSLVNVKVPEYQREILADGKIEVLKKALTNSRVPDIDLGMRGNSMEELSNGEFLLHDDVYVIDGLQRNTAAKRLLEEGVMIPHLGAMIHVDTNEEWERRRFQALNTGQTNLNTNVLLRNLAKEVPAAGMVYQLTQSNQFVLKGKVCWQQNMRRGDLLTAISFYKVIGRLHSHLGPGRSDPRALAQSGIPKILERVSHRTFAYNVITFFNFLNESYGILDVAYRKHAVALKGSFLMALAGVLSDYEEFWDGDKLAINADLRRKLAIFQLNDPYVKDLASSAGKAISLLENLLVEHINSGKRTRRLKRRDYIAPDETVSEETEE